MYLKWYLNLARLLVDWILWLVCCCFRRCSSLLPCGFNHMYLFFFADCLQLQSSLIPGSTDVCVRVCLTIEAFRAQAKTHTRIQRSISFNWLRCMRTGLLARIKRPAKPLFRRIYCAQCIRCTTYPRIRFFGVSSTAVHRSVRIGLHFSGASARFAVA